MKKLFKSLFKGTFILLFSWVLFLCMLVLTLLVFASGLETEPLRVEDGSILVFNLSQNIPDSPPAMDLGTAVEKALRDEPTDATYLYEVLKAIERAASDDRIEALYLYGSLRSVNYGSGYGAMLELRRELEKFKSSGKPVYAFLGMPSQKDLFLTSVADRLFLNPYGQLDLRGLGGAQMFFKNTMEKFGIGVQVARVGAYKSAVEPFTREALSPENREQLEVLLEGLWDNILQTIGASRGMEASTLDSLAESEGLIFPERALELGLVDELAYQDEIIEFLIEQGEEHEEKPTFRQVSLLDYIEEGSRKLKRAEDASNQIAVVYAEGAITAGSSSDGTVGGETLARRLREVRKDDDVKAVVLRVNSPGGSAYGSEKVLREMKLLREAKPVVVSMGSYAASGGYWIATYGDRIFAEPNTITGSIGVFLMLFNTEGAAEWAGLTFDSVKTAAFADLYDFSRPKTPEEMAIFQGYADWIYESFIERVSESRDMPAAEVRDVAQGRVWLAEDALDLGLIDAFGGLRDAIAHAIDKSGVGADYRVVEYPRKKTLEDVISDSLGGSAGLDRLAEHAADSGPVGRTLEKVREQVEALSTYDDPRGVYLRAPFDLRL